MTITIKLKTDNAAFTENPQEVYDILNDWLQGWANGDRPNEGSLKDSNGNKVGEVTVKGK